MFNKALIGGAALLASCACWANSDSALILRWGIPLGEASTLQSAGAKVTLNWSQPTDRRLQDFPEVSADERRRPEASVDLGLIAEALAEQFQSSSVANQKADRDGKPKEGEKGFPTGKVILIGAGVAVIAYGIPWLAEKGFERSFKD